MGNCNSCPYLYMCRATKVRHCDGKRFSMGSSHHTLRELSFSRILDVSFKKEISSWDNNYFYTQIRVPCKLSQSRVLIIVEECRRRGIVPLPWITSRMEEVN